MIKSRKGFVSVLLALLTIFVLVPSMAFAANAASWTDKYATVTDVDGLTFQTVRTFDSATGLTKSDPQDDTSVIGDPKTAPTDDAYFFDLEGSSFAFGAAGAEKALDGTTWTQTEFAKLLNETTPLKVKVIEQAYTPTYASTPYDASKAAATYFTAALHAGVFEVAPTNWTITLDVSDYEAGLETDQTVTFSVKAVKAGTAVATTPTAAAPDLQGTIAKATVTVKGQAKDPSTAKVYIDSKDSPFSAAVDGGALLAPYDGAAHTVVLDEVPGYDVAYAVYNSTTGKYDTVSAVSITDVQDAAMQVKATFTDTKTKATTPKTFTVNLAKAIAVIGFDHAASMKDGTQNFYSVEGAEYNAMDFIAITPYEIPINPSDTDAVRAQKTAVNAAYKAAVDANKAEINAWFAERYDITATPSKADANNVGLKIEAKNLTSKELADLEKKYEAVFNNNNITLDTANTTATLALNSNGVLAPEIEFIDSPTAVTYKAKKLKKKAASFTVTAVSSNNEAVTYKLKNAPAKITIDKATGEITLDKGLKKGKYKVTVKAYIPKAYNGLNGGTFYPSETHDILIKVKK